MKGQGWLVRPADFRRAYSSGRAFTHPVLALYALTRGGGPARAGFAVGRRFGGAVDRNRAKRRLREAYRRYQGRVREGFDLVFVARHALRERPFEEIVAAVGQLLDRAEALAEPAGEADAARP